MKPVVVHISEDSGIRMAAQRGNVAKYVLHTTEPSSPIEHESSTPVSPRTTTAGFTTGG